MLDIFTAIACTSLEQTNIYIYIYIYIYIHIYAFISLTLWQLPLQLQQHAKQTTFPGFYSYLPLVQPTQPFKPLNTLCQSDMAIYFTLRLYFYSLLLVKINQPALKYFAISHSDSCNKYCLFHLRYLHNDIFRYKTMK